jgi:hypothetical protein
MILSILVLLLTPGLFIENSSDWFNNVLHVLRETNSSKRIHRSRTESPP